MGFGFVILFIVLIAKCRSDNVKIVVQGNEEFTVKTYKELVKISGDNNFIFSGLSAGTVLSLLGNGAEGDTRTQLLKGLSLPEDLEITNKGYYQLQPHLKLNTNTLKVLSANKIYPAKGFNISEKFNDIAVNIYESGVQNLDYNDAEAAAYTINKWVEDKTNNKIKNLISPSSLSPKNKLVLVNALYFTGRWLDAFEVVLKGFFYTSTNDSIEKKFMHSFTRAKYNHDDNLKAAFLELDFKGGNVSMTFVLPDSPKGLAAVERDLEEYLKPRNMKKANVRISLPNFIEETTIDFTPILKSFGITKIFTPEADLSGISDTGPLQVDYVIQKAFIDCNPFGVEAAAATAVLVDRIAPSRHPGPIVTFKADHPFLFYLRENDTGATLFAGRYQK